MHSEGQGETFAKQFGNITITSERLSFHIDAPSILPILFHEMTEFIITWILIWNKRSHLKKKVCKFLINDLRHSPAKPLLKVCAINYALIED